MTQDDRMEEYLKNALSGSMYSQRKPPSLTRNSLSFGSFQSISKRPLYWESASGNRLTSIRVNSASSQQSVESANALAFPLLLRNLHSVFGEM